MEVDLKAVHRVFEDVLSGRMSREQADRWAYAVVQEEEIGVVTYSPPGERERIWAGVMYLYGIDAMKAPNAYLHSNDDIREAMMASLDGNGHKPADDPASPRAGVAMLVNSCMAKAFSSEVDTGSRKENASRQESGASVLIQSEPTMLSS
jgi:hypothetical protein